MSHRYSIPNILALLSAVFVTNCSSSINRTHLGAFITEDQQLISIRKSEGNTLRYRIYETGETGRLYPVNDSTYISGKGFSTKEPEELRVIYLFNHQNNRYDLMWKKINARTCQAKPVNRKELVSFKSGDIKIIGRLDLPDGEGPFPGVVLVHGSGNDKATDYFPNGDFFAANGIAALTYDKRGTGHSQGEYTFDYNKLAKDVVAGIEYMSSREDINSDQLGLSGYSQGGWVAPLAASKSDKIKYVIVNYGMIESAIEEARMETRNILKEKGVEEKYFNEIDELSTAAIKVVASGFKEGWDKVNGLDKKYKKAPWRNALKGTTVYDFLKYPKWMVKLLGPVRSPYELNWTYESTTVLDSLQIPITWLLADSDSQAPNELTIPKIYSYMDSGKQYELKVFTNTDHGMLNYEVVNGQRVYTQYAADYFQSEVEAVFKWLNL